MANAAGSLDTGTRVVFTTRDLLLIESTLLDEEDDEIAPLADHMAWELGETVKEVDVRDPRRKEVKKAPSGRPPLSSGGRSLASLIASAPPSRKKKGKKPKKESSGDDFEAAAGDEDGAEGAPETEAAVEKPKKGARYERGERSEPKVIASNWRRGPQRTVSNEFTEGGDEEYSRSYNSQGSGRGYEGGGGGGGGGYYEQGDGGGGGGEDDGFFQDLGAPETRDAPWRKPDMVPFDFDAFSASVPQPAPEPQYAAAPVAGAPLGAYAATQGAPPPGMPGLLQSMFSAAAAASPSPVQQQQAPVAPAAMPGLLQSMFMAAAAEPAPSQQKRGSTSVFGDAAAPASRGIFDMFGGGGQQQRLPTVAPPTPSRIMSAEDLEQRWGR